MKSRKSFVGFTMLAAGAILLSTLSAGAAPAEQRNPSVSKAQAEELAKRLSAQRKAFQLGKRQQELRLLNAAAMSRIRSLKPAPKPLASGKLDVIPEVSLPRITPTHTIRITGVTPQPVVPGNGLTVLGDDFGTGTGKAFLKVEGMWITLSIADWKASHILVTIPAALAEIVGAREKSATLSVHREGGGGGTFPIRLGPDMASRLTPQVLATPREVKPGQIFFIEGKNFAADSGMVHLIHVNHSGAPQGTTQNGIIDAWSDTLIAVHLREDLGGFQWNTLFRIEVETGSGLRSTEPKTVLLDPNVETEVLVDSGSHRGGEECDSPNDRRKPATGSFISFEGLVLKNGWRLVSSELKPEGINTSVCGCRYAVCPPREHTTTPGIGIFIDNINSCNCTCNHIIEIEGPKGFSYE